MALEEKERKSDHDRISHVDLLNLLRGDIRDLRNEMRWLIGVGFVVVFLFIAVATFVR